MNIELLSEKVVIDNADLIVQLLRDVEDGRFMVGEVASADLKTFESESAAREAYESIDDEDSVVELFGW